MAWVRGDVHNAANRGDARDGATAESDSPPRSSQRLQSGPPPTPQGLAVGASERRDVAMDGGNRGRPVADEVCSAAADTGFGGSARCEVGAIESGNAGRIDGVASDLAPPAGGGLPIPVRDEVVSLPSGDTWKGDSSPAAHAAEASGSDVALGAIVPVVLLAPRKAGGGGLPALSAAAALAPWERHTRGFGSRILSVRLLRPKSVAGAGCPRHWCGEGR